MRNAIVLMVGWLRAWRATIDARWFKKREREWWT